MLKYKKAIFNNLCEASFKWKNSVHWLARGLHLHPHFNQPLPVGSVFEKENYETNFHLLIIKFDKQENLVI